MAGGTTTPMNKPNGVVTVYYGNATSCVKHLLDKQDWNEAQQKPDKALWSTSAQSGTVIDGHGFSGNSFKNGCYRGWE